MRQAGASPRLANPGHDGSITYVPVIYTILFQALPASTLDKSLAMVPN
jgi:hypothetical protein